MNDQGRYINPFTDFGFKKLFGSESNKELLIDFLDHALGSREQVRDLTYLNTENLGVTEDDRKAMFDLYCENGEGDKFIIELQNVPQEFFKDRSIFYATFPIQQQATRGSTWNYRLKAVYTIGILNFHFHDSPDSSSRYFREVQLLDKETFEVFYDKLTFIFLELSRFRKKPPELRTHFDKWLYALKHMRTLKARPAFLHEKIFEKLFSEAEVANLNPEEMKTYQESLKAFRDHQNAMDYMLKKGLEKGMKQGVKRGVQQGVKRGVQQGIAQGASQKAVEIAKRLKEKGVDLAVIAETTGLPEEQIAQL